MKKIIVAIIILVMVLASKVFIIKPIDTKLEIDFNTIHTIVDTDTLNIEKNALSLTINDKAGNSVYGYKKGLVKNTGTKEGLSVNKNTDTIRIIQLNGNQFLIEDYTAEKMYLFYF